jgi:hypothetical protein
MVEDDDESTRRLKQEGKLTHTISRPKFEETRELAEWSWMH